jgi:hypothetical protein
VYCRLFSFSPGEDNKVKIVHSVALERSNIGSSFLAGFSQNPAKNELYVSVKISRALIFTALGLHTDKHAHART